MSQEIDYTGDFSVPENYSFKSQKGLNEQVVRDISKRKNEPQWMLDYRLEALKNFEERPMQKWGPDLSPLNMQDIYYYIKPVEKQEKSWDDVPKDIKYTFDKLGVPEDERKHLAGMGAQYESEVVYHNLKEEWAKKGVIFLDTESGLREHPELFKKYFGSVVPLNDNKFAALNSAVWRCGSFIYIPKGVQVTGPLQTYF